MLVVMERSDGREAEIWGTWEDLLLAFAVLRHGAAAWDAVADEVRCRARTHAAVTSQACRDRYVGLRKRFDADEPETPTPGGGGGEWMEQLRQLRLAELRREVERYDVSIGSLQTKLKTLTEDSEQRRVPEDEQIVAAAAAVDLENHGGGTTPDGDLASGNRPGGGSCGESTSAEAAAAAKEKGPGEGSCNGSSDSIAKVRNTPEAAKPAGGPPESGESMAESKESGDVQSSASLTKNLHVRRRKEEGSGGSSGGTSPEEEEVSPSGRRDDEGRIKSRPLADFLEMIRSNKHGSVFEHRLEIQESPRYRSMIRQHIDLGMIRSKLEGAAAASSYSTLEFFRDLLLLCNNAVVFFPKHTAEHTAGAFLRDLVNKEIAATTTTNHGNKKKQPVAPSPSELPMAEPTQQPPPKVAKSEVDVEDPANEKPSSTGQVPLLACRKRTSAGSSKAASPAAEEADAKVDEEEVVVVVEEKLVDLEKELGNVEKRKRDVKVARGLRTTKARAAVKKKTINVESSGSKTAVGVADDHPAEPSKTTTAVEKKNTVNGGVSVAEPLASNAKKKSAASFLDRLKKSAFSSSPSSSSTLLQTLKNSGNGIGGGGGGDDGAKRGSGEHKKGGKGEGKKEKEKSSTGRQVGSRQAQDRSTPVKRSVGRPPKRPPQSSKRAREIERDTSPTPPPPARGSSRKKTKR